jgi:membrane protein implicated in regulation of membrane protease activity
VNVALVFMQAVGAIAVLAGVWLLLPLGGALAVDGALLLVLATLAEVVVRRAHRGAPAPQRRDESGGPV